MKYIGIDTGLSGAVAIIYGDSIQIFDAPTTTIKSGKKNKRKYIESVMVDILEPFKEDSHVCIEAVHSMPGQGVAAMFSMGEGYGLWRGIVATLRIPYTLVTPQAWKKEMMAGMGKEKAASCLRAQQLYPDAELFTPRGRALDGRGDALLIATYLRRIL